MIPPGLFLHRNFKGAAQHPREGSGRYYSSVRWEEMLLTQFCKRPQLCQGYSPSYRLQSGKNGLWEKSTPPELHTLLRNPKTLLSTTGPEVRSSRSTHTGPDVIVFNKLFHPSLCMQNTNSITPVFHRAFCEALLFVQVISGL